jgi:hypothetical protein
MNPVALLQSPQIPDIADNGPAYSPRIEPPGQRLLQCLNDLLFPHSPGFSGGKVQAHTDSLQT